MDVSNASVYDGRRRLRSGRNVPEQKTFKGAIVRACHPDTLAVVQTYCFASDTELSIIPAQDGKTDLTALDRLLDETVACVPSPATELLRPAGRYGSSNATSTRSRCAYDSFLQPYRAGYAEVPWRMRRRYRRLVKGSPRHSPSFGGPYLGYMAAKSALMRKLPGRIVGETVDADGNRAFVLTLQAREQHIKREKASSSICSNQALCALTASGLSERYGAERIAGRLLYSAIQKAHYAADAISTLPGFSKKYNGDFFHEFVTDCPVPPVDLTEKLAQKGFSGGLHCPTAGFFGA